MTARPFPKAGVSAAKVVVALDLDRSHSIERPESKPFPGQLRASTGRAELYAPMSQMGRVPPGAPVREADVPALARSLARSGRANRQDRVEPV